MAACRGRPVLARPVTCCSPSYTASVSEYSGLQWRPSIAGVVIHIVSIVETTVATAHVPANDFYQSASLCALLIAILFLFLYWRYGYEGLGSFHFPARLRSCSGRRPGSPVGPWTSPEVRSFWLAVHIVLVLIGYAALLLTAVTSIVYLIRERQLKRKKTALNALPPLGRSTR